MRIAEFTGCDTSGTNGSGAIVQAVGNTGSTSPATVTLSAFGASGNATFGLFGGALNNAFTVGSGFTQDQQQSSAQPLRKLTEYLLGNDTSVDCTFTDMNWGGIAVELKASTILTGAIAANYL